MADTQLDDLTGLSDPVSGDLLYICDISDSTDSPQGTSKKVTVATLLVNYALKGANADITSLTGLTTPLSVAQGGTGVATLTGIVKGSGTSALAPAVSNTDYLPVISPVMTTPQINDTSSDHQYIFAASELAADRTVTLPLLAANDTFVFANFIQTLTNKTLTTPKIASLYQDSIGGSNLLTMPAATDTLVGKATADTLTNKGISGATNTLTAIPTTAINDAAVTSRKMKLDQIQYATSTTDMNTGSTSYIDYTGLTATFTPNVASNFLVLFQTTFYFSSSGGDPNASFVINLDGSVTGNNPLVSSANRSNVVGNYDETCSGFLWITGVTSTSHTIKVQLKTSSGTLNTRYGSMTVIPFAS